MLDYNNVDFPKETYYIRHPNRIYFSTDFYDGEKIFYYNKHTKPSSNARGYRWYRNMHGLMKLVHWTDIKHGKLFQR